MVENCIEAYGRLKNLKLVGLELGVPWQTVYVWLRKAGIAVVGDKSRYGSDTDKLAAKAECEFSSLVPAAINNNLNQFQAKVDFNVGTLKIDIKASNFHRGRWMFSVKKQEFMADFIVAFGYLGDGVGYKVFLLPGEVVRFMTSITISAKQSKWLQYEIEPSDLEPFFMALHNE